MDIGSWDTLFIADVAMINAELARSMSKLVTSFDVSQAGFAAKGSFSPWSVVPGGSDQILYMQLPIASGTLTMQGKSTDLSGIAVTLGVHLALLPAPSGGGQQLVFSLKGVGKASDGPGIVEGLSTQDPTNRLTPLQQKGLPALIATALVQNASSVSFIFATINPVTFAGATWLNPVNSAYAFADTTDGRMSLAIFSVTDHRDISSFSRNVDPTLLDSGSTMALAMSPRMFMQNVLRPALAKSFSTDQNQLQADAAGVLRGSFNLPTVTNAGTDYTPYVSTFSGAVADTKINLNLSGSCDMRMNITMHFTASASLSGSLDVSTLTLKTTLLSHTFEKDVDVPWYDRVLDILGAGIGAIIFEVSVTVIGDRLGDMISSAAGGSNVLADEPATVTWAGADGFRTLDGGLASCFYIRGATPAQIAAMEAAEAARCAEFDRANAARLAERAKEEWEIRKEMEAAADEGEEQTIGASPDPSRRGLG